MHFLSHLLQLGYFSILMRLLNGYLLFAANLDDFHSIAKKLVPENLADSLTQIAAKPKARERDESYDYEDSNENEKSYDYKHYITPHLKGRNERHKFNQKFILSQSTQVDFDELVERVKKRLALELKQKYENNIKVDQGQIDINKENKNIQKIKTKKFKTSYKDYNIKQITSRKLKTTTEMTTMEEMSPFHDIPDYKEDIFNKPKLKPERLPEQQKDYEYAEASKDETPLHNQQLNKVTIDTEYVTHSSLYLEEKEVNKVETKTESVNDMYKKIEMTGRDSYEDYATPKKETNIYASSEVNFQKFISNNKRYKVKNRLVQQKRFDNRLTSNSNTGRVKTTPHYESNKKNKIIQEVVTIEQSDDEGKTNPYEKLIDSLEIKAKTENLWYGKPDIPNVGDDDTVIITETSAKSKYPTRLPTRQTYKMVTPDYYAKLPVVAEKYDFNEPIPEKDRERENIKYIGNPPASINKKVRLT